MELTSVELKVLIEGKKFPQFSSTMAMIQNHSEQLNLLFDLGSPYDRSLIERQLNDFNIVPSQIHYVINSHWHMDHIGSIDLFENAILIVARETLEIQQRLYEAVILAEESPAPIDALTGFLTGHLREKTSALLTPKEVSKIRAMANITLRNAPLLKKYMEKYHQGRVIIIHQEKTVLFGALEIMKTQLHTEGDLIVRIKGRSGPVLLMGDAIVSQTDLEEIEKCKRLFTERFSGEPGLRNHYILPGHDRMFLCE